MTGRRWRWSWESFFAGTGAIALPLLFMDVRWSRALLFGAIVGLALAVEERKGLVLPRRLWRE